MTRRSQLLAPIAVAMLGAATGLTVMALTYGSILDAVHHGRSPWLLLLLAMPLLPLAVGMAGSVVLDRIVNQPTVPKPPVIKPEYRIVDDEYDPIDRHFTEVATALTKPPFGIAVYPPRMRQPLTPEQLELAAQHARDKRSEDGQDDPQ